MTTSKGPSATAQTKNPLDELFKSEQSTETKVKFLQKQGLDIDAQNSRAKSLLDLAFKADNAESFLDKIEEFEKNNGETFRDNQGHVKAETIEGLKGDSQSQNMFKMWQSITIMDKSREEGMAEYNKMKKDFHPEIQGESNDDQAQLSPAFEEYLAKRSKINEPGEAVLPPIKATALAPHQQSTTKE